MKLLGYDLKYKAEQYLETTWNDERRRIHLPSVAIHWPKSVYFTVWPSWFDQFRNNTDELFDIAPIDFDIPNFLCKTVASIGQLVECLPQSTIQELLLIKIHRAEETNAFSDMQNSEDTLVWTMQGYDVADEWRVSAISNCGIGRMIEAGRVPAISVNQHALFDGFSDARAFIDICNHVLPTHRPFYVYKIEQADIEVEDLPSKLADMV